MVSPSAPSDATIKRLYARSGNQCAFPGCKVMIVQDTTMVGAICHIRAARSGGPRYDTAQPAAERHGEDNLILLCANHHRVIDGDAETYTPEALQAMKAQHQASVAQLTEEEARAGAGLLISLNQSGGIAAHHIGTINIVNPVGAVPEALPVSAGMTFVGLDDVLSHMGPLGNEKYHFNTKRFIYLRLRPAGNVVPMPTPRLLDAFNKARILPMSERWSGTAVRNKCGAMFYAEAKPKEIAAFTQGFASGELWGMNSAVFEEVSVGAQAGQPARMVTVLPAVPMEKLYINALNNYAQVAQKVYELPLPYTVELGIKGILDAHIEFPRHPDGFNRGPIFEEAFRRIFPLTEVSETAMAALLDRYFDDLYAELVGCHRRDVIGPHFIQAHGLPQPA